MNKSCEVRIQQQTLDAAQALAAERDMSVDQLVDDAVQRGIGVIRQHMYFEERMKRARNVSVEEVIHMLRSRENNHPPDPGDEIPDDLKHLLEERGR